MRRFKMTVYLKGGASFTIPVKTYSISYLGDEVTKMTWEALDGFSMPYIALNQIAAVVSEEDRAT